ncbi:unnamed protein product, partial [marine sediment metagenome]
MFQKDKKSCDGAKGNSHLVRPESQTHCEGEKGDEIVSLIVVNHISQVDDETAKKQHERKSCGK